MKSVKNSSENCTILHNLIEQLQRGEYVTLPKLSKTLEKYPNHVEVNKMFAEFNKRFEDDTQRYLGALIENLEDQRKVICEHFIGYTDKIDKHEERITRLEFENA